MWQRAEEKARETDYMHICNIFMLRRRGFECGSERKRRRGRTSRVSESEGEKAGGER